MISLKNINFSYGEKKVIENFSLEIHKNSRICLFGESGCGKTTLLYILLGLLKPQSGEALIDKALKPSVVFQENRLLPFADILKNITITGADEKTAVYHLTALGLGKTLKKHPNELSGGMCRRVSLARALAADFDYLILDEPFTGLDIENINTAATHILKNIGERPLILVTHSPEEAKALNCEIIYL